MNKVQPNVDGTRFVQGSQRDQQNWSILLLCKKSILSNPTHTYYVGL